MKRFTNALFAALLLSSGLSAPAQAQSGFAGPKAVVGIDAGDSGELNVRLADNTYCGSPIVFVSRAEAYYNDMVAIAMTAFVTNKPVNVYVSDCTSRRAVRMVMGYVF